MTSAKAPANKSSLRNFVLARAISSSNNRQTSAEPSIAALQLVKLPSLMNLTRGSSEISIGLIDGPVAMNHVDFAGSRIEEIGAKGGASCQDSNSEACRHGTFIAGILSAKHGSDAPAVCPACTLLVRPIFSESSGIGERHPSANPAELGAAIFDCIRAGARVINLSLALIQHSRKAEDDLRSALDQSMFRGVVIVAAAGNQSAIGGGVITRHPWVIPVAACDQRGFPSAYSNCGHSIGGRGLRAPGDGINSSVSNTGTASFSGTSVSAAFVTGTIALLLSMFPSASGQEIRSAVTNAGPRRASIVPPLLDAWAAYRILATNSRGGRSQ
jgi:subtilisin family serine protease